MAPQLNSSTNARKILPSFTIRLAISSDAESIRHIGSTVFSATFGHSLCQEDLNAYLNEAYSFQSVLDDIANPFKTIIVAVASSPVNDSKILGFATLTQNTTEPCIRHLPRQIELQRLYVHGDAAGKGVGSALMAHVEDVARANGFRYCWLGVWEFNYRAQRVYERAGYRKFGDHDFVMGQERQTDWILVKELADG